MSETERLNLLTAIPKGLGALEKVEGVILHSDIDPLLRHLVKLRVSQINGCAFCVGMHLREARADGEAEARLDNLVVWPHVDCYSAAEKAALAWAEALTTRGSQASLTKLHRSLAQHFTEEQIGALCLIVVMINSWNRLQVAAHNEVF